MSNPETKPRGGFFQRIFARSTPSQGNGRTEAGEIPMMSQPADSGTGKRLARPKSVLVIAADDSASRRWRKEMETTGYGVESVSDAPKGLDILYGFSFDALLIDFTAPGVDGLNFLRQIRGHDELKSLFIGVFIRDKDADAEAEMAALDAGANRVFPKVAVKPEEILTALKTALFPRILQAQPRAKQASAARGPAAPPPAPKLTPVSLPAISLPTTPAADAAPAAPAVLGTMPPPRRTFRVPPPEMGKSGQPMPTVINKKILIIDADESVAASTAPRSRRRVTRWKSRSTARPVSTTCTTINPDALLLDLLLPEGMSGSEILKKTRAQKKFEKIPILVFTNIYTRTWKRKPAPPGPCACSTRLRQPRTMSSPPCTRSSCRAARCWARGEPCLPRRACPGGRPRRPQRPFPASRSTCRRWPWARPLPQPPRSGPRQPRRPPHRCRRATTASSRRKSASPCSRVRRNLSNPCAGSCRFCCVHRATTKPAAQLLEMYTRVHSLTGNAAIAGFTKVARLSGALEAMLREFQTKPEGLNASTKRTLTQAMDFLARLFTNAGTHEGGKPLEERILVVDDEIISRRVIGHSLEKAGLKSTAVSHPDEALKLLQDRAYDLIFLDVEMPGMNGFELCKRLRAMPLHANTPVIFVTALNGFESRAKSSLSGGDDFIGKPFSYIELAVKGLIYVLKGAIGEKHTRPALKERVLPAVAPVAEPVPAVASV